MPNNPLPVPCFRVEQNINGNAQLNLNGFVVDELCARHFLH